MYCQVIKVKQQHGLFTLVFSRLCRSIVSRIKVSGNAIKVFVLCICSHLCKGCTFTLAEHIVLSVSRNNQPIVAFGFIRVV